jgi:hypothetical protein
MEPKAKARLAGRSLICAIVALTWISLGGASSAAAAQFHFSAASASISGVQEGSNLFTVEGSSVGCKVVVFTGTGPKTGTAEAVSVHPEWTGCEAFGTTAGTVNSEGCQIEGNASSTTVALTSCTKGGIVIVGGGVFGACEITVPNQTGLSGVTYSNMTPRTRLKVSVNITNIHYIVKYRVPFGCPFASGTGTNAKYTGIVGFAAGGEVWVE